MYQVTGRRKRLAKWGYISLLSLNSFFFFFFFSFLSLEF